MAEGATAGIVIASVIGAGASLYASNRASQAQQQAAEEGGMMAYGGQQAAYFGQAPWIEAGQSALYRLMGGDVGPPPNLEDYITPQMRVVAKSLHGVSPWDLAKPYYDTALKAWNAKKAIQEKYGSVGLLEGGGEEFTKTPGYEFALKEGLKGVGRAASSTGRLGSGAYLKDSVEYAKGLASQEYQNFLSRWYQMAGLGSTSAVQTGNQAYQGGLAGGQYALYGGQAQAAEWMNYANTVNRQAEGAVSNYLYDYYRNPKSQDGGGGTTPYQPYYTYRPYRPAEREFY